MGFPSKEMLDEALKSLENAEGSIVGPKSNSQLDVFRHKLQQQFVVYKRQNNLSGNELADILGTDKAKVSKLLRNRIDKFSTDKLISWHERIAPKSKLLIA